MLSFYHRRKKNVFSPERVFGARGPATILISWFFCRYLLMLAAMLMEVNFFVAVICGLGVGHYIFSTENASPSPCCE